MIVTFLKQNKYHTITNTTEALHLLYAEQRSHTKGIIALRPSLDRSLIRISRFVNFAESPGKRANSHGRR
jgi:hypothetical protein